MKRDSRQLGKHREKLGGEKLRGKAVEPVLEPCTDYVMFWRGLISFVWES